jgi:hypothetical protein
VQFDLREKKTRVEDFIPLLANLVAKMPLLNLKHAQPVSSDRVHQLHLSLEKRILD